MTKIVENRWNWNAALLHRTRAFLLKCEKSEVVMRQLGDGVHMWSRSRALPLLCGSARLDMCRLAMDACVRQAHAFINGRFFMGTELRYITRDGIAANDDATNAFLTCVGGALGVRLGLSSIISRTWDARTHQVYLLYLLLLFVSAALKIHQTNFQSHGFILKESFLQVYFLDVFHIHGTDCHRFCFLPL